MNNEKKWNNCRRECDQARNVDIDREGEAANKERGKGGSWKLECGKYTDTKHNDTKHNDIRNNDIRNNDIRNNDGKDESDDKFADGKINNDEYNNYGKYNNSEKNINYEKYNIGEKNIEGEKYINSERFISGEKYNSSERLLGSKRLVGDDKYLDEDRYNSLEHDTYADKTNDHPIMSRSYSGTSYDPHSPMRYAHSYDMHLSYPKPTTSKHSTYPSTFSHLPSQFLNEKDSKPRTTININDYKNRISPNYKDEQMTNKSGNLKCSGEDGIETQSTSYEFNRKYTNNSSRDNINKRGGNSEMYGQSNNEYRANVGEKCEYEMQGSNEMGNERGYLQSENKGYEHAGQKFNMQDDYIGHNFIDNNTRLDSHLESHLDTRLDNRLLDNRLDSHIDSHYNYKMPVRDPYNYDRDSNYEDYMPDKGYNERDAYFESFHQTPHGEVKNTYYNPFAVKHRRRTSKMQLRVLEKTFETNIRPDAALRKILGEQLGMTPRSVQVWFQNRRAKIKKSKKYECKREGTFEKVNDINRDGNMNVNMNVNMNASMNSYNEKYSNDKYTNDHNDKYTNDKYTNDKYTNDKYTNDKYTNDKYTNDYTEKVCYNNKSEIEYLEERVRAHNNYPETFDARKSVYETDNNCRSGVVYPETYYNRESYKSGSYLKDKMDVSVRDHSIGDNHSRDNHILGNNHILGDNHLGNNHLGDNHILGDNNIGDQFSGDNHSRDNHILGDNHLVSEHGIKNYNSKYANGMYFSPISPQDANKFYKGEVESKKEQGGKLNDEEDYDGKYM